jgi:hypothetical protein
VNGDVRFPDSTHLPDRAGKTHTHRCRPGFCRDAEHCMQGGSCADAVGDLTAMWADDHLLTRVGTGHGDLTGEELEAILTEWHRQITDRAATVCTVSFDLAHAAIQAGREQVNNRARRWFWSMALVVVVVFVVWLAVLVLGTMLVILWVLGS